MASWRRIDALTELRQRAAREGVFPARPGITDQDAEKVLGDLGRFLNKPYVVD